MIEPDWEATWLALLSPWMEQTKGSKSDSRERRGRQQCLHIIYDKAVPSLLLLLICSSLSPLLSLFQVPLWFSSLSSPFWFIGLPRSRIFFMRNGARVLLAALGPLNVLFALSKNGIVLLLCFHVRLQFCLWTTAVPSCLKTYGICRKLSPIICTTGDAAHSPTSNENVKVG